MIEERHEGEIKYVVASGCPMCLPARQIKDRNYTFIARGSTVMKLIGNTSNPIYEIINLTFSR